MTAKEYLQEYGRAKRRAEHCRRLYAEELELIDAIGSSLGGDGTPHGARISRRPEDMAIRLTERAEKWKLMELEAEQVKENVADMVLSIPGDEGDVLFYRYIELMDWRDVEAAVHYSRSATYRIHQRALALVESKLELQEIDRKYALIDALYDELGADPGEREFPSDHDEIDMLLELLQERKERDGEEK